MAQTGRILRVMRYVDVTSICVGRSKKRESSRSNIVFGSDVTRTMRAYGKQ